MGLVGALAVAAPSHAVAVITPDLVPLVEEGIAVADPLAFGFDAANITLTYDTVVSVIFVSEGAGYRSTFGWYDASLDPTLPTNRNVIWNNASMAGSGGSLNTGDTVTLGSFAAGSAIGFFLTADGFSNASAPTYYTNTPYNPDGGVIHTVSSLLPIEGLVALGFEDLWGGGDRDYNDVVVAIDLGPTNVASLPGIPENDTWILLLSAGLFMALTLWWRARPAPAVILRAAPPVPHADREGL
ncbi:MAG: hypothetical protein AUJ55_02920 [Proteobacteria bacterium CG1_02_64_396]|nr:MAG: hypothetical protein AUJ55_02920 [Proteobacteria bacterium CG1_02_64_396]